MTGNQKVILIVAIILALIFLCGTVFFGTRLYASSQFTDLPNVPTFAYSTAIPFATPIALNSPLPTLIIDTTPFPFSPTATITPINFFTPTNIIFAGTSVNQNFSPINPTTIKSPTSKPPPTLSPTASATLPPPPPISSAPPACYNILYPVKPGTQWSYLVASGSHAGIVNTNITSVAGSFGSADVLNINSGVITQAQIICDQDIILSFPFLDAQTLLGQALNGSMNVNYASGVLAPNESAFKANNWALSWTTQYIMHGNGSIDYNGNLISVTIDPSTINMVCQTLGSGSAAFETVSVGAGTYNALKVVCSAQGQVSGTANGSPITGVVNAQSTQWFMPHIGPLRIRADAATLTIFGITIPFNPDGFGTIDLQGFSPGP